MGNNQTIESSILRVLEKFIVRHTIPIFRQSEKKPPKKLTLPDGAVILTIVGSGIFATYQSNYIILTAAHVLKGESKTLFIPHPNEDMPLIELIARFAFYTISESPTKDIGCILLTREIGDLLRYKYEPIDLETIELNPDQHIVDSIELFAKQYKYLDYCICGYPAAAMKAKDNLRQQIIFNIRLANEWRKKSIYVRYGIDPKEHTIIQAGLYLDPNGKRSVKYKIPPMNGMSGCGVWSYYPYYDRDNKLQVFYKLAGIFHTHNKGRHEFMQFTKFSVIDEDIKTKVYPFGKSLSISVNNGPSKSFWG